MRRHDAAGDAAPIWRVCKLKLTGPGVNLLRAFRSEKARAARRSLGSVARRSWNPYRRSRQRAPLPAPVWRSRPGERWLAAGGGGPGFLARLGGPPPAGPLRAPAFRALADS